MSDKVKKILGIAILIVIAFVGYRMFFVSPPEELLESEQVNNQVVGRELLNLLSTVQAIELEGRVFKNEEFRSLQDFGVDVVESPLGRRNPFAPIGIGNLQNISDPEPEPEPEDDVDEPGQDEASDTATTT